MSPACALPWPVPWQGKQLLHTLERSARDLWKQEPGENKAEQTHAGEEVERSIVGHSQQHRRHSLGVAVLVGKVERHHDGSSERSHAQWQHFRVEQVLHRIPAHGPADSVEHGRHHHSVGLLRLADHGKQLWGVDGDGVGSTPLAQNLDQEAQHHSDANALHRHERPDVCPQRRATNRFSLDLQLFVDVGDFRQDNDFYRGWVYPLVAAGLVQRSAVVGEIRHHDTEIHRSRENVVARSSNGFWRTLRYVAGSTDNGGADTETLDQTASIQLANRVARDLDDGGDRPHQAAHLQGSDSSQRLGSIDRHKRATDGAQLDHRRNVGLEIGQLRGSLARVLEPKLLNERGLGNCS
ncbi:hypothetical protein OGATHE_006285 [Ogataea polymorpha]|uniref:Uncharacterized protein n=1 Tax=Ogataea polymorpha TaxID=460523 RepID=A0A9P8SYH0_9ASCO|nr:hypothetical protein OGATHE_006285 [Ogataea polymorpha]